MTDDGSGANRARYMFADEEELAAYVRQMIREGAVVAEVAEAIGYSSTWVYRFARRHGIALQPGKRSRDVPTAQAQAVLRDFDSGSWTLEAIGERHGLSAERVRQIAERWGRLSRSDERTSQMFSFAEIVREALLDATSLQQVAERTGLSVGQIRRVAEIALGINPADITERNRQRERDEHLAGQSLRLRLAIEMAGLTHKQVAQAVGIQASRVTNIANGKVPGVEAFRQPLARVCGVEPQWLVSGDSPPAWLRPELDEETLAAERAGICVRMQRAMQTAADLLDSTAIARACGISTQQLGMLVGNRSNPRRYLPALAQVLCVSERWLRTGIGYYEPQIQRQELSDRLA